MKMDWPSSRTVEFDAENPTLETGIKIPLNNGNKRKNKRSNEINNESRRNETR